MRLTTATTQFLNTAAHEYGFSPQTIRAYTNDLKIFTDYAANQNITDTTQLTLTVMRDWLWQRQQTGATTGTLSRNVATLKSFSNWLEAQQITPHSIASRLRSPKKQQNLPRVVTEQQIRNILDQANSIASSGDPVARRDAAILETLYATGIRVAELCTLKLQDIDTTQTTLRVSGKGNKERIVPYGKPAAAALAAYLDVRQQLLQKRPPEQRAAQQHVFLGTRGGKLAASTVYKLVAGYLQQLPGSGPAGPHTLRHTAATHLLNGGAELRVLQEILGHENLTSTQVYTHVSTEHLAALYQQAHPRA